MRKLGYIPKAMPPFEYRQLNDTLMLMYAAFKEDSTQANAEVIVRFVRGLEDVFLNVERRSFRGNDLDLGCEKLSG